MEQRIVYRYSMAFKRQVVEDIESGRFGSVNEAKEHYSILGSGTINKWVRRFGKNHLCAKVVRVEKLNEKDELRVLKEKVKKLEQLLGRKEAEKSLNDAYLEIACEELGVDVEEFKKKESSREFPKRSPGLEQE